MVTVELKPYSSIDQADLGVLACPEPANPHDDEDGVGPDDRVRHGVPNVDHGNAVQLWSTAPRIAASS